MEKSPRIGIVSINTINNSKMNDERLALLNDWLVAFWGDGAFTVTIANNDASFRRYFRIKRNDTSFIAMDAPPQYEDCKPFVRIANHLITGGICAPKIIYSNLNQGFLLLEDFGKHTFWDRQRQLFNIEHYKNAINTLIDIQSLSLASIDIPHYDKALLTAEMQLLIDWYLPPLSDASHARLKTLFTHLTNNALAAPQVFVHRDYHSRNLMLLERGRLGVIDFQDATIGANTYDLVSLLKDAYFELNPQDLDTLLRYYYYQAGIELAWEAFKKQFDLMGLQRHLKILGIFKRLSVRDGKNQYLSHLPLVKKYTLQTANQYPEFALLKTIL